MCEVLLIWYFLVARKAIFSFFHSSFYSFSSQPDWVCVDVLHIYSCICYNWSLPFIYDFMMVFFFLSPLNLSIFHLLRTLGFFLPSCQKKKKKKLVIATSCCTLFLRMRLFVKCWQLQKYFWITYYVFKSLCACLCKMCNFTCMFVSYCYERTIILIAFLVLRTVDGFDVQELCVTGYINTGLSRASMIFLGALH